MTLKFTGGEYLQRGRGLGGLLRLAKSVFSPIVRTVTQAAKSNTGKAILNALKEQAIESTVNLATDALRGNDMSESFQGELSSIRENAANSIENLRNPRKRPKKKAQKGSGCESKAKKSRRSGASSNRSKLKNVSNRNRKGLFA